MSVSFYNPEIYDDLVDKYDIFEYRRDAVMFMAVLGYVEGEPRREDYRGSDDEQGNTRIESFYSRDLYRVFGSSLAYQDTGDPDALVDLELQAKVISQYATGGLEVYEDEIGDVNGDPTDAIVNYIQSLTEKSGYSGPAILKDIQDNFDDQMANLESE